MGSSACVSMDSPGDCHLVSIAAVPGYIFERSPEYHNTSASLPADYSFGELASNDVAACTQLSGLSEQEIRRRFEQGERCLGVLANAKQVVNLSWLHFGPCYVRRSWITPGF